MVEAYKPKAIDLSGFSKLMDTLEENIEGVNKDHDTVYTEVDDVVDGEKDDKAFTDVNDPFSSGGFHEIMQELVSDDDEEGAKALTTTDTDAILTVVLDLAGLTGKTSFASLSDDDKKKFKEVLTIFAAGYNGEDTVLSKAEFDILAAEAAFAINNSPSSISTPIIVNSNN